MSGARYKCEQCGTWVTGELHQCPVARAELAERQRAEAESVGEVRWLGDVQRLALGPGDIVVLSNVGPATPEAVARLRRQMEEFLPGHRCLVLTSNWLLGVLENGDDGPRTMDDGA
jgi:hypothetical protein